MKSVSELFLPYYKTVAIGKFGMICNLLKKFPGNMYVCVIQIATEKLPNGHI